MDSTVVLGGNNNRRIIVRLRIFPSQLGVIVSRAGCLHGSKSDTVDTFCKNTFTNQPVGIGGGLFELVLLDHDSEAVADTLIQCSRLALVLEVGSVLGDTMSEFVTDDVQFVGEAVEDDTVSITKDHLFAVPHSVVIFLAVVNRADERETFVVNTVAVQNRLIEVVGCSETIVALVGISRLVANANRVLALSAD